MDVYQNNRRKEIVYIERSCAFLYTQVFFSCSLYKKIHRFSSYNFHHLKVLIWRFIKTETCNIDLCIIINFLNLELFVFSIFFIDIYIYIYIYIYHHHHHVVPLARISLTLSRHFSPSFIALGRSPGLHPVSSHSCCMYVLAGRPAFARPYVGVHRSTSLMSSSLLLQQCPACLIRLTRIVFVIGGRWPYSWCLVGCCLQDLFNIALSLLV